MASGQAQKAKKTQGVAPFVAALLLSLVGMVLAAYLIDVHREALDPGAAPAGCDFSEVQNCSGVARSPWATVLGVPTAAWALLAYAGFFLLALAGVRRRLFSSGPGGLLFWGAFAATAFGAFLIWIMHGLGQWCVVCLGLDAVHVGLLTCGALAIRGRGVVGALKGDLAVLGENKPAAIALVGGPILAGVLVLVAYPDEPSGAPSSRGSESDAGVALPRHGFAPPIEMPNLEGAPVRGPEDATITIIEFSDYECPFCAAAHDEVRAVMEAHRDQFRLAHFHHPLDQACHPLINRPFHRHACLAASAAICAQRQGRFWQVNDLLFENGRRLSDERIRRVVEEAGEIDMEAWRACVNSDSTRERILFDLEQATHIPVEGTPAYVINGRVVAGYRAGLYRTLLERLLENDGEWPEELITDRRPTPRRDHDHD